jgi:FAD/FMN-containing dehydrogenase/Fe-S oxidoreductase
VIRGHPLAETARRARDLTPSDIEDLGAELRRGVSGGVRTERAYRLLYATDASIYQMEPAAVVFPESAADVQHTLRVAAKARVPVLPRGGGTGLSGQSVNHAIVLDFTPKMDRIIEIDRDGARARVQPGVVLSELNKVAAPLGLHYPIDPSTANRATVGGGIGNNSCGAHSVVYGKTIDQVLSLDAVLADASVTRLERLGGEALRAKLSREDLEGRIYREVSRIGPEYRDEVIARFPKIMRRVSGYNLDEFIAADGGAAMDLSRMVVGSEGTLAVVTEGIVKLAVLPKVKGLAAVHFRTVVEAAEATVAALEYGPSAVELVDDVIIRQCRANPGFRRLAEFVEGDPGGILLIEFFAESEPEALARMARLSGGLEARGLGYAIVSTTDPARQRDMWRMREAGLGLIMSNRGDAKGVAFVEDTAVAPEKLPAFVARFGELVAAHGTSAAYYGHASVGCLHIRPAVNMKTEAGLATMQEIASEVADLVLEFGGSLSGEHGDGIVRGVFTERMFGPRLYRAFQEVKQTFDPNGLLNPGKIVETPGLSENLRMSPQVNVWEPRTHLDFSFEGGMARAAEQCNGQGACRKLDGGMCPSFMVTRDEEHSTRGRANLLRLTFTGVLPPSALREDRLHEALDLCVECKACKAECPSGVDLAKLKFETLAQRNDARGVPLRSRAFANIARLSAMGSRLGRLANALAGFGPARVVLHRLGGVHRERPLPRFAPRRFSAWWRERARSGGSPGGARGRSVDAPAEGSADGTRRGEAVYFCDTFTEYFHPEAGQAAVRVLEALGYTVTVVSQAGCCGRPAISKGMLDKARSMARRNVDALLPYARRGAPIVGTEPSCLLSFRDEYPDLLRDGESREVAEQAVLLDELVLRLLEADPSTRSVFGDGDRGSVLLHAHCHQKAIAGAEPSLAALRLAGYAAALADSGCCGMAGSFGFEVEHYEVSRAMGAYRLFPAVEAAAATTEIAVTGVSCRQQIGHFTSRQPRHTTELLAAALRQGARL